VGRKLEQEVGFCLSQINVRALVKVKFIETSNSAPANFVHILSRYNLVQKWSDHETAARRRVNSCCCNFGVTRACNADYKL